MWPVYAVRMAVSNAYLQYVLEQLSAVPGVTSRRMFGGIGLYSDGFFFGLIDNDTLFFKVDDSNRSDYTARGMPAFQPFPDKPDLSMSYFSVPADALEDPDELAAWARKSITVAIATARPARAKRSARVKRPAGARRPARVKRPAGATRSARLKKGPAGAKRPAERPLARRRKKKSRSARR
jgi:DNA transformation protein and related proteins